MTVLLVEKPTTVTAPEFLFGGEPPDTPALPTAQGSEDGTPRCGVCGEDKVKLLINTTYKQLEIWICTNIPPDAKMPCDGWIWRDHVRTVRERMEGQ